MTLPATGPLTLADVRDEFSAPAGTPLHSLNRGGTYVPNTAANAAIPTSPPITLHDFHGASATIPLDVSLSTYSVSKIITTPGSATTATVTATASGGSGTKTYAWTRKSGDTGITITSSTSATTAFSANVSGPTSIRDAVFVCTVTDASGSAVSGDLSVHIEYSP